MVIWSRWGILAFFFIALGVGIGFGLGSLAGYEDKGGGIFVGIGLLIAAVALFLFDRFVLRRYLDKPRPVYAARPLAQPITHPDGQVQTQEWVPVVDQVTGQPLMEPGPTSTLFFIPLRFWPFIVAGAGLVLIIVGAVEVASG